MIIQSSADLDLLKARLEQSDYVVIDTETTGLNVRKEKVIGIGFGLSSNEAYYLPIYEYIPEEGVLSITGLKGKSRADLAKETLELIKSKKIICHNAAFDLRIIKNNLGVDLIPSLYCDTLLLKHTCDEVPPFGLKEIATKLWGDAVKDEQVELKQSIKDNGGEATKKNYELYKADMSIIAKYCIQDCKLTYRLFDYYSVQLQKDKLVDFFYNLEVMPLYKLVTIPMQNVGIRLDIPLMQSTLVEITEDIKFLEQQVQEKLNELCPDFKQYFLDKFYEPKASGNFIQTFCLLEGEQLPLTASGKLSISKKTISLIKSPAIKAFIESGSLSKEWKERIQLEMHFRGDNSEYFINLRSKDHLRRIVFDFLGERPTRYTEKGAWAVDEDLLDSIKERYAFVPLLISYNKLNKIKSTYIDRFLEEQEDGIFYPSFQQHRTISGRYGSDLQQLPRQIEGSDDLVSKYTNLCRKFFISREGKVFIDTDYESLEPHVFSHVSGDPGLHKIFNENKDFYSSIAIPIYKLEGVSADKNAENYLGKVNKNARQVSKAIALGVPYGMTDYKLSKELNIDQKDAKILIDNYMKSYPKLHQWMKDTDNRVVEECKISSLAGRVRRMPKALEYVKKYGNAIFDDLDLWKRYNETPALYAEAKEARREFKNFLNNGKNFQIQSLSASIVNLACIEINKQLCDLGGVVVAQVHDQIVVEIDEIHKHKAAEIVKNVMENIIKLDVKLKAPPAFGYNLAESH